MLFSNFQAELYVASKYNSNIFTFIECRFDAIWTFFYLNMYALRTFINDKDLLNRPVFSCDQSVNNF